MRSFYRTAKAENFTSYPCYPMTDFIVKTLGVRMPMFAAVGLALLTYHAATAARSILRATTTPLWRRREPFPTPLPPGVAAVYFQSKTTGLLVHWRAVRPEGPARGRFAPAELTMTTGSLKVVAGRDREPPLLAGP